ncbi:MAG: DUF4065 domain-containing protein [Anaerolineaceae bacterium]|nr:DUF4065 domain-containing protein [Anaerolineaceae bacterium]
MNGYCPVCKENSEQSLVEHNEELHVRGEKVQVVSEYLHCTKCKNDFKKDPSAPDAQEVANMVYRERKGMMQPSELIKLRKSFGLTQKEFSLLLGIGIATLNRYENGALQTEAHDQMIRLYSNPKNLRSILAEKSEYFSEERYTELSNKLYDLIQGDEGLLNECMEQFGSYDADIYSGNAGFNAEKLFQAIKFFCFQTPLQKAKLKGYLWLADFMHYRLHGESITGLRYIRTTFVPKAEYFNTWLTALTEWRNELQVEERITEEHCYEVYSTEAHDWSLFTPAELAILATVKDKFKDYTTTQIRDYLHEEKGWKQTKNGELISYEFASHLRI